MGNWHTGVVGRGIAAAVLAVGLAAGAVGCSSDDGGSPESEGKSTSSKGAARTEEGSSDSEAQRDPIAQVKGKPGMVLTVYEVKRDSGGFVTISGVIENTATEDFIDTNLWAGDEEGVDHTSLMGATLVDKEGKKRYFVLRDTEKRCLCTTGLDIVSAGKSVDVYMQFPAPPEDVKEIEFQLPTFTPTTLPLSE
ncbi:hypothetical protein AB0M28_15145 [Streptomyces sp. NPDC051940]|uniref:hypothetical protein n=1 Tax=Streptomyces sp. NPDC051940 TaxID=3155675 RepID=UPI003443CC97